MSTREPAPTRPKPAAMATTMFGRYKLLGRIGEGGMAEVYRALMTGPEGFERELVLKRILPRLSESGDFKTMFVREAKICAQMTHPNIIQIYEFGQADGGYFIAHRAGTERHVLADWTPNPAIKKIDDAPNASNELAIKVAADSVRFLVNGTQVNALPRGAMLGDMSGETGVRVNHNLDVHVGSFVVKAGGK